MKLYILPCLLIYTANASESKPDSFFQEPKIVQQEKDDVFISLGEIKKNSADEFRLLYVNLSKTGWVYSYNDDFIKTYTYGEFIDSYNSDNGLRIGIVCMHVMDHKSAVEIFKALKKNNVPIVAYYMATSKGWIDVIKSLEQAIFTANEKRAK